MAKNGRKDVIHAVWGCLLFLILTVVGEVRRVSLKMSLMNMSRSTGDKQQDINSMMTAQLGFKALITLGMLY